MVLEGLAAGPGPAMVVAQQQFESSGNEVLGYVAGFGVVIAVLALTIIGGRMIHANFTGDPWIAARGMAELPWVVLGVVLLVASGSLAGVLLQGSRHETDEDLGAIFASVAAEQGEVEQEAAGCAGALKDPDSGRFVCPDDDGWDELANTLPLTGPKDARCTRDGAENCFEYCFVSAYASGHLVSAKCNAQPMDDMEEDSWIWADYHCPNLGESWWNRIDACPDAPTDDEVPDHLMADDPHLYLYRVYNCEHYRQWVTTNIDEPDKYCDLSPR
jgi:hypothetical protein